MTCGGGWRADEYDAALDRRAVFGFRLVRVLSPLHRIYEQGGICPDVVKGFVVGIGV